MTSSTNKGPEHFGRLFRLRDAPTRMHYRRVWLACAVILLALLPFSALAYSNESDDARISSPPLSDGIGYVYSVLDSSEVVNVPSPQSSGICTSNGSRPETWPSDIASIAPSDDTVTFDPSKVAYIAAHDSTIVPPGQPLFVCDGSGDDEREINDALAMMQGGTVYLLDGTFHCSGRIVVPGHTRLSGQGSTETMLEVLPRSGGSGYLPVTLNQPDVTVDGFSLFGNGFVMVTTSHVRIRDIVATSWDRSATPQLHQASGNGMFFVWATTADLQDIEFYNCKAIDCHTHGFNMNQQWDLGQDDSQAKTIGWVRFVGCQAIKCGFGEPAGSRSEWITGFDFHEWQDLRHMWAIDCVAENNWESGFHLEPGGRYDENGDIFGRTISEDIHLINCTSKDNGQRNTYPGHFFMSGYYLSRDTHLENCYSENNRNAGYYIQAGENSTFSNCSDVGSTFGWKICKNSSDITLAGCRSEDNLRWALWISFSQRVIVENFHQVAVGGDSGYQSILGWYGDEPKVQQPVNYSSFEISSTDSKLPIVNQAGNGNIYSLMWEGEAGTLLLSVPGAQGSPTNVGADGVYDDINGNFRVDFADVVLYFNQMSWIAANEPVTLFDYNGNDRIDFADVVWLFNHL